MPQYKQGEIVLARVPDPAWPGGGWHFVQLVGQAMPRCVQPGHRLAATLLKGASRYRAKLCPSHRFCSRKKCLILGRVNYGNFGMPKPVYNYYLARSSSGTASTLDLDASSAVRR